MVETYLQHVIWDRKLVHTCILLFEKLPAVHYKRTSVILVVFLRPFLGSLWNTGFCLHWIRNTKSSKTQRKTKELILHRFTSSSWAFISSMYERVVGGGFGSHSKEKFWANPSTKSFGQHTLFVCVSYTCTLVVLIHRQWKHFQL